MMGANYVLDTNFSADVVIMEEGTELLNRVKDKHSVMPMFTSCCPGWVSFVEQHRPDMLDSSFNDPFSSGGSKFPCQNLAARKKSAAGPLRFV